MVRGDRQAHAQFGGKTLRELALKAIAETKWYPPRGQNRIGSMVESRPDWVLSRQRAGRAAGDLRRKENRAGAERSPIFRRIEEAFEAEGADAWFISPPERFLGVGAKPKIMNK